MQGSGKAFARSLRHVGSVKETDCYVIDTKYSIL